LQIQLLSNQVTTQTNSKGKPMQVLEVAYKNLTFQGKVESKKLFDFGVQADSFKTLATATPTTIFDVEVVKNTAGYNDWVKVTKGTVAQPAADAGATSSAGRGNSSASTAPAKGNWETPEERAKKQVYIIRQSSLANAVATLSVGAKTAPKREDIIELAKYFEGYVLDSCTRNSCQEVASKDIESLDEDIPF
jgi:hypothetical protein